MAYSPNFFGGVNVALADINLDHIPDIITAPGAGGGPHVKVFSAADNSLLHEFMAYDSRFTGGVFVAGGDLNRDGYADVVTGAGPGGGPNVICFDGRALVERRIVEICNFFAYDPAFNGGITVAVGDLDGDGATEIITGAGPGGGPHVRIFSPDGNSIGGFMAYAHYFRGGVFVATGDIDGNGTAEILTGPGIGGGPHLVAYDRWGRAIVSFVPFPGTSGTPVAGSDVDHDGRAEIVGVHNGTIVVFRDGLRLYDGIDGFTPYPGFFGEVRIASEVSVERRFQCGAIQCVYNFQCFFRGCLLGCVGSPGYCQY